MAAAMHVGIPVHRLYLNSTLFSPLIGKLESVSADKELNMESKKNLKSTLYFSKLRVVYNCSSQV